VATIDRGVTTEEPPSSDQDELRDLVEGALDLYRRLLPASALRQFRSATLFLLDVHPAARQWQGVLRSTWMARRAAAPSPPADSPRADDAVAGGGMLLGFVAESTAEREHYAELLAHEAEAGLRLLVEAPFPPAETPAEGERALRHLVDLALAALFSGALGALLRRLHEDNADEREVRAALAFMSAIVLVLRVGPKDKDDVIFNAYFGNLARVEEGAKQRGRSVAEEQQAIVGFLERFSRTIKDDVPRIERDIRAVLAHEPKGPSRPSVPGGGRARRGPRRRQRS
jgi:hypothetical protein